jgi:hypothetical protein
MRLANIIYKDANLKLERKFEKFEKVFKDEIRKKDEEFYKIRNKWEDIKDTIIKQNTLNGV